MEYKIKTDKLYSVDIQKEAGSKDSFCVSVGENTYNAKVNEFYDNGQIKALIINQSIIPVEIERQADGSLTTVYVKGIPYTVEIEKKQSILKRPTPPKKEICGDIKSPLPGQVLNIFVSIGEKVEKGQPVILLESMKMENEITSPKEGVVKKVFVEVDQMVKRNDNLIMVG